MFFFPILRFNKIVATLLSAVVIAINIYFVKDTVEQEFPDHWSVYLGITLYAIFYLGFCLYLVLHMAIAMGANFLTKNVVSMKQTKKQKLNIFMANNINWCYFFFSSLLVI